MAVTALHPSPAAAFTRVCILGATGSIGQTTLSILRANPQRFGCVAMTAQNNLSKLVEMAVEFKPQLAVIGEESLYPRLKDALAGSGIRTAAGREGLKEAASLETDIVMSAIVGMAGLEPTIAAIENGTKVALANKESLVAGGELLLNACKKAGCNLIPVDSEHHAIFQLLGEHTERGSIEKITLTASGGPFLSWTRGELATVTPSQAVQHPNWSMGAKISVDSATLMNKGLELIEAHYLFNLTASQIDVVIHPESIIHGLVHFSDGAVFAHMSLPDMATPIAGALCWPERLKLDIPRLDLVALGKLSFAAPDTNRFPCLQLAIQALKAANGATIVLNAANEAAVARFLNGEMAFMDIPRAVGKALEKYSGKNITALEDVLALDYMIKQQVNEFGTTS